MNNTLDILFGYIDIGWTLTPNYSIYKGACNCPKKEKCKNPGKHPRTGSDGKALASRDKEQIKSWLADKYLKYSNWAVQCGIESGIIAFDIDPRNGGKRDAFDFPPTLEYETGGGGIRLIYKYPDFEIEGNSNFGTGVELIVNGYITLPPSNHISGNKYKWINDLPIADITQEFILLGNLNHLSKESESERFQLPDEVKEGERDNTAFKYACSLRAKGLDEDDIFQILLDTNTSRFTPPLDEQQIIEKVNSACKYQKGKTGNSETIAITDNDARFKLGKASDAFEPRPRINWIIKDMVKENSLNMWFGKYGHKKTFCALSAAVCVASGTPWIGQSTIQSPVLFIDEESGQRTLLDRLQAAIKGESQDKDIPINYLSLSRFNFLKTEYINIFQRCIEESNSKLIFIDAFDDVMAGSDENSVKDNQPVLIQLRRICEETNSAIILLHHTNKNGGMRGSTSIPGSLNTALKIESENSSSIISFTTDKMRDSKPFTKDAEIIYVDKDNDYSQLESFYLIEDNTPFEAKANDTQKEILCYMKANNNILIKPSFLESIPKGKRSSYNKAIYSLRDHDIIHKDEGKSTPRQAVYVIS